MTRTFCHLGVLFLVLCFLTGVSSAQSSFAGIWHLDSLNVKDSSGNGAVAHVNGCSLQNGKFSKALSFDGVNDYVSITGTALNPSTAITLEAWVLVKGDTFFPSLISKGNLGNFLESYALYVNGDGSVAFLLNSDQTASGRTIVNGPVIRKNVWTHVAGTYDSTTMRIYVNGTEVASGAHSGGIAITSNPVLLGKSDRSSTVYPDSYLRGMLDEVRIWSRALSADEVMSSAQGGLRALWHFNETSGAAVDSSGFGNNAVPTGVTTATAGRFAGARGINSGGSGFFTVPTESSLEPAHLTVDTWIKGNGAAQQPFAYLMAKGAEGCVAASYALYTYQGGSSSNIAFYVYNRSVVVPAIGTMPVDSAWHHVAGTFDGQNVSIYVDGQLQSSVAAPISVGYDLFTTRDLSIGRYAGCDSNAFTGSIDETRVWARALTASEIKALYAAKSGSYLPSELSQEAGGGVFSSSWNVNGGANTSANVLGFVVPDLPQTKIAGMSFRFATPSRSVGSLDTTGWSDHEFVANGTRVDAKTLHFFTTLNTGIRLGMQFQWPPVK